jgi:hypothetical protein
MKVLKTGKGFVASSEGMFASLHESRQKHLEFVSRVKEFSASRGRALLFEFEMFWDGRDFDPHR